ncbi:MULTISPECIES: LytTR family DNA-binding domain-containing protein [Sporosarcina]|uniref:LytTR family DNA-binding domain-containing protein n=1 Tax=Sporosarcina TaxID=1569 RepID=UPI00129A6123|nr:MULTISPECIES: LytTR family DNA-binding domain-containing protein [Sporosarcina]GKV64929.1 DNA-binding response regulator [Sporosarcina sp. NCCP-2331]GLB55039.1 DNA-binding response regulator [Sporosarcina sp. NCCP-2378]
MENVDIPKKILNQYATILDDWVPKDASIAIAIKDRYIYYDPGMHDIHLKEGQDIQAGSIAEVTIKERRKVEVVMDNTLYGMSYFGMGYPIDVKGEPGALIIILPPNFHVLKRDQLQFLTGKREDEWYPIPIEQVTYVESLHKKTWFYTNADHYNISFTLKDLQLRLPRFFLRIHRSYIINMNGIEKISRDFSSNLVITLVDGTELPVSQTYINEVRSMLGF